MHLWEEVSKVKKVKYNGYSSSSSFILGVHIPKNDTGKLMPIVLALDCDINGLAKIIIIYFF